MEDLTNLTHLNIRNNEKIKFTDSFAFDKIQYLNLNSNKLVDVAAIHKMTNLIALDIKNCKMYG